MGTTNRALVVVPDNASGDIYRGRTNINETLKRLGYFVDHARLPASTAVEIADYYDINQDTPTAGGRGPYEFVVFVGTANELAVNTNSSWAKWPLKANRRVPMFFPTANLAAGYVASATYAQAATASPGTAFAFTDINFGGTRMGFYGATYEPAVGEEANITSYATRWGVATHNVFWKHQGTYAPLYVAAGRWHSSPIYNHYCWFPIILDKAIADGSISSPRKRIPLWIDFDDTPDTGIQRADAAIKSTLADIEYLYSICDAYGIKSSWGFQTFTTSATIGWRALDSSIKSFLLSRTIDKGGLILPQTHGDKVFYTAFGTYAQMRTRHTAEIALLTADGFSVPENTYGYMYFPNHALTGEGLRAIEDIGVKVIRRAKDGTHSPVAHHPPLFGRGTIRGMKEIGYRSYSGNYAADSADDFQYQARNFGYLLGTGQYFDNTIHGDQFYINHDGVTENWCFRLLERFGIIVRSCPNVLRFAWPHEGVKSVPA